MTEIILGVMLLATLGCWVYSERSKDSAIAAEREEWHKERQQLLDRIQAPSFDHLKHHEVKMVKAQKEETKQERELIPV